MTAHDDHGALPAHAGALLARLESLRDQFAPVDTSHMQHIDYSQRSAALADLLRGAWSAAGDARYAAALVVLRSALEHHLLDRLLFLANRSIHSWGVKAAHVAAEEKRLAELQAGPRPDIVRWRYDPRTGKLSVVIRGIFAQGSMGRGATLSPYHFRIDRYDPFVVGRTLSGRVSRGFRARGVEDGWAEEARREWYGHVTYERLGENLDLNRLLVPRLGVQVDVHWAFLSAFVHPTQKGHELLYGHNMPSRMGGRDHYCEELVLLYVIALGGSGNRGVRAHVAAAATATAAQLAAGGGGGRGGSAPHRLLLVSLGRSARLRPHRRGPWACLAAPEVGPTGHRLASAPRRSSEY